MKKTRSNFKCLVVLILISMLLTSCVPGGHIGADMSEGLES